MCQTRTMTPVRRPVLAFISAQTSRIMRSSDDVTIKRELLSLPTPGLLVTCTFSTPTDAMCWLTDPLHADAVRDSEQAGLRRSPTAAPDGGWLAVMSRDSSACFKVSSAGTSSVVSVLGQTVSPVCAVGRLAGSAAALEWLASSAVSVLLTILGDSASAVSGISGPAAPARCQSPLGNQPPARAVTDRAPSAASQQSAHGGLVGQHGDVPRPSSSKAVGDGQNATDAQTSSRSPFAVWSAHAAASEDAYDVDQQGACSCSLPRKPRPLQLSSPHGRTDGTRTRRGGGLNLPRCSLHHTAVPIGTSPVPHGGAVVVCEVLPSASSAGRSSATHGKRFHVPEADADGLRKAETSTGPDEQWPDACARPVAKKTRLIEQGGVPAVLNPSSSTLDLTSPTFSRERISRMMADTKRAWERSDAMAARLRREARVADGRRTCEVVGVGQQLEIRDAAGSSAAGKQLQTVARVGPTGGARSDSAAGSSRATTCTLWAGSGAGTLVAAGAAAAGEAFVGTLPLSSPARGSDPKRAVHASARRGDLPAQGNLGRHAADGDWQQRFLLLVGLGRSTFVTGGPGVGKSTFLKGFLKVLKGVWSQDGQVVTVAPTGSAAKTANGQTYHSFFGFPRDYKVLLRDPADEASRLFCDERFKLISRRLGRVRVLLLDEVSMVPADKFDVMWQLLRLSRPSTTAPCLVYAFGDFLQLGPLTGSMAFESQAWEELFRDSMLELTTVHRQSDPAFVQAIDDARYGVCTPAVTALMRKCAVSDQEDKKLKCSVLHIMPRHEDVLRHNSECLADLFGGAHPLRSLAVDSVSEDKDRDRALPAVELNRVSVHSRNAALLDCVAPRLVEHCIGARVMLTTEQFLALGLYHGSIGRVSSYKLNGTPVVRFEDHTLPAGVGRGAHGVYDAGKDWLEMECPVVAFEARILAHPGAVAFRLQLPFVLGWGITVHRSQSLTQSEAVLDIGQAFGPGMVNAAISRVGDKNRMFVRSFTESRLFADPSAVKFYREGVRL